MTKLDDQLDGEARLQVPSRRALVLRPLGYTLMAVMWTALWILTLALGIGPLVLVGLLDEGNMRGVVESALADGGELVAGVLLVPVLAALWGPGFYFLLTACWPLAALSAVYVVRSLRPSYARERLSFTSRAERGQTLGPPIATGVALSLQPVRASRLTDLLMRFYRSAWNAQGSMFVAWLPAGLGWQMLLIGLGQGMPAGVRTALLTVGAALVVVSLVLAARALRGSAGAASPSVTSGPPSSSSPQLGR